MVEIGALIGSGRVADAYAYGDRVLKLYHHERNRQDAFFEAAMLAVLEPHGLPVPRVHEAGAYDGRWGLVMDRVAGETLGARAMADPAQTPVVIDEMVRLQRQLHAASEPRLRSLKTRLAHNITQAPSLNPAVKERRLAALTDLPEGERICHGDLHPFNIIGAPGKAVVIDWLDVTAGAPAADACRSYLLLLQGMPGVAEPYLDCYVRQSDVTRNAILAWLPTLAAARLNEGTQDGEEFLIELAQSA